MRWRNYHSKDLVKLKQRTTRNKDIYILDIEISRLLNYYSIIHNNSLLRVRQSCVQSTDINDQPSLISLLKTWKDSHFRVSMSVYFKYSLNLRWLRKQRKYWLRTFLGIKWLYGTTRNSLSSCLVSVFLGFFKGLC